MHSTRRSLITLSAALLLGVALGLAGSWGKRVPRDEIADPVREGSTAKDSGSATAVAAAASSTAPKAASSSANAYAAAWELIQDGTMRREKRRQFESMLLREWSKVDLRAALHASLEGNQGARDDPFESSRLDAYLEEATQSDLLWELALSGEYGLHTRRLRREWIDVTARRDPLEILRRLPEMPPDMRAGAVGTAVTYSHHFADFPRDRPAAGKEEVIAAVLDLRGSPYEAAAMAGLAGGISSITEISELSGLLLSPPDPALRDVYLKAYAMEVEHGSSGGRQVALDILTAEVRAEVEALLGSPLLRIHGLVFPWSEPVTPSAGK